MKNTTDGSDRLSNFHDSLLGHILGFLDMKQVVHTSFLSKRWRYVWKSVSNLNFDHSFWKKITARHVGIELFIEYRVSWPITRVKFGFMDFVDHILSIHDGSVINKFNLNGADYCQKDRIDKWLSTVVGSGVQEIYLYLDATALSQFIFITSTTHLKKLHLASVQFPNGSSETEIMLDCPPLETLSLCYCCFDPNLNVFCISAPQLRKLVCHSVHISCTIKLCAPNLISFTCTDSLLKICHMENISAQVLTVSIANLTSDVQKLLELLKGLKYATTLDISNCWLSVSNNSDKLNNVENVDVEEPFEFMVQELKIRDLQGNENEFMVLSILFRHAPYLKTVHITTTRARKSAIRKQLAKFGKKLHSLPKASPSVGMKFVVKTRM